MMPPERASVIPRASAIPAPPLSGHLRQLRSVEQVAGLGADELERVNKSLARLERYWTDQILYRL